MKAFFANLSRSTKITWITCGCFILLTMLILIFLMLCPIQASDSYSSNDALVITESTTTTATTSEEITTSTRSTTMTRITTTTADTDAAYQGWSYTEADLYSDNEYDYSYNDGYQYNNDYNYGYVDDDANADYNTYDAADDVNETAPVYEDTSAATDFYAIETQTYTEPVAVQTEAAVVVTDMPSYTEGLTDGGIVGN